MKYFLDTEFMEDGITIDLLSIALVAEDGRELYIINNDADYTKADDWVKTNVIPKLIISSFPSMPKRLIKQSILTFINEDPKPKFWGYYADYDWVCFCQLFGKMIDLPKGWPMYCRDLKQLCDLVGNPKLPIHSGEHNALIDAQWNKRTFSYLEQFWRVGIIPTTIS